MKAWPIQLALLAALQYATLLPAQANETLWAKLKEGGRVALVRHTAAPGAPGDPRGFKLGDCATQRNLSAKGRADAQRLGDTFRARRIPVEKVLTSEWCRCRQTAELMAVGPIETAPTFNNAFVLRNRRDELTQGARAVIASWSGSGVLVVTTHGANILALAGTRPAEGAVVVVEPDPAAESRLRMLGQILPNA